MSGCGAPCSRRVPVVSPHPLAALAGARHQPVRAVGALVRLQLAPLHHRRAQRAARGAHRADVRLVLGEVAAAEVLLAAVGAVDDREGALVFHVFAEVVPDVGDVVAAGIRAPLRETLLVGVPGDADEHEGARVEAARLVRRIDDPARQLAPALSAALAAVQHRRVRRLALGSFGALGHVVGVDAAGERS